MNELRIASDPIFIRTRFMRRSFAGSYFAFEDAEPQSRPLPARVLWGWQAAFSGCIVFESSPPLVQGDNSCPSTHAEDSRNVDSRSRSGGNSLRSIQITQISEAAPLDSSLEKLPRLGTHAYIFNELP